MLKFTSGGIERGARPMWELHDWELVKDRCGWKAGRRNEGMDVVELVVRVRSRGRIRALDSILCCCGRWTRLGDWRRF